MKRLFKILAVAIPVLGVVACTDKALTDRVDKLEARVAAVEAQLKTDATNIKALLDAVNDGVVIKSVTPITDGFKVVFSDGKTYEIKNGANGAKGDKGDKGDTGAAGATGATGAAGADGKDGKDGSTPVVTIEKGTDGNYYWVINGTNTGVRANGDKGEKGDKGDQGEAGAPGAPGAPGTPGTPGDKGDQGDQGAVPSFKIENGHVYYSFDGTSWTDAGALASDTVCPITGVKVDEAAGTVTFTLAGGDEIVLPFAAQDFALVVPELNPVWEGNTVSIAYVLRGASDKAVVLAYFVGAAPAADITVEQEAVVITSTGDLDGATLVIEAIDNALDANNVAKKVVRFEGAYIVVNDDSKAFSVAAEGGRITVGFKSNYSDISYNVPAESASWISQVAVTRAMVEYSQAFTVAANETTSAREGKIEVKAGQKVIATVTVSQEGKVADKFAVEDVIGSYEGSFQFGMFNGTIMQGPQTEKGDITIAASDNESKGNVMFTEFNGNACSIYASFDLATGALTMPSGASITTVAFATRTLDRDVVFSLDEATKTILTCASKTVVCSVSPGVPIYYAIDALSYSKKAGKTISVEDFAGTYSGGVTEVMMMNGAPVGTQDRKSVPQDFVFEAGEGNNVVMTKYYGAACNVAGVFDPATKTATFSSGTVTVVQGTGSISTPLVLTLSDDCSTLTQTGNFAIAPNPMIIFVGTLTVLTKKGGSAPAAFSLSDITGATWTLTYDVDGQNWTDEDSFTFQVLTGGQLAFYGANLYASGQGGQGKSFVINLDEATGKMTIPSAKVNGLVFSGIVEYDSKNDRLRVPRNLVGDVEFQLAADKKTFSAPKLELSGNETYGVGPKTLTNVVFTKK